MREDTHDGDSDSNCDSADGVWSQVGAECEHSWDENGLCSLPSLATAVKREHSDDPEADFPTICVLGATGTGKSSTCNTLFKLVGEGSFLCGKDMDPSTQETMIKVLPWRGQHERIRCVDTPGFGDPRLGRDVVHLRRMIKTLQTRVKVVHAFCIVFNSRSPRMDEQLMQMLAMFKNTFGSEFLNNVVILFTHWGYGDEGAFQRDDGDTKGWRAKETNHMLRKLLGHDFDCPCVFLDNMMHLRSMEELETRFTDELPHMVGEFERELDGVFRFLQRRPFCCAEIVAVLSEKDDNKMQLSERCDHLQKIETAIRPRRSTWSPDDVVAMPSLRFVWASPPGSAAQKHL